MARVGADLRQAVEETVSGSEGVSPAGRKFNGVVQGIAVRHIDRAR